MLQRVLMLPHPERGASAVPCQSPLRETTAMHAVIEYWEKRDSVPTDIHMMTVANDILSVDHRRARTVSSKSRDSPGPVVTRHCCLERAARGLGSEGLLLGVRGDKLCGRTGTAVTESGICPGFPGME